MRRGKGMKHQKLRENTDNFRKKWREKCMIYGSIKRQKIKECLENWATIEILVMRVVCWPIYNTRKGPEE